MMTRRTKADNATSTRDSDLGREASAVLSKLRDAARRFVEAAPTPVLRAADLHRALDIDPPLGWQLFRVAMATDPLAIVAYVPRAGSLQKILQQAREMGWDADPVSGLGSAYASFEEFIQRVAGTRGNFDAMIAVLGSGASEQIQARHRSAAFRANAKVWGVQARTYYRAWIAYPGPSPKAEFSVSIYGWIDLRRLRSDTVLGVRRGFIQDAGGVPMASSSETRILEEFSSAPYPRPETITGPEGTCDILRFEPQETSLPATLFAYQQLQDCGDDVPQLWWGVKMLAAIPTQVMLVDMLVPRTWIDARTARVSTHGNLTDVMSAYAETQAFELPAVEQVQRLGGNLQALHTPDVPRCPELVRKVLDSLDCTFDDFEILRCRVRYPILHSLIWMVASAPGS